MGYVGAWPAGAVQTLDVTKPYGKGNTYFAKFSNFGIEVDLTGTGCGIISTYPKDRFAVMDGTSMACPCTTGALARLLAKTPKIVKAARDASRGDQIVQLALTHARDLGFAPPKQGAGLLE
jgi:subtilisin